MQKIMGFLPGWKKSPVFEELKEHPQKRVFVEILEKCKHQRPVIPTQGYIVNVIDLAGDSVLYGKKTAQEALDESNSLLQNRLEEVLKVHVTPQQDNL